MHQTIINLYFFMWELTVVTAIIFFISGLDDLFFDIYYWTRALIRKIKTRKYTPLTYKKLNGILEKRIAILTPCWHEANIIEVMLRHNCFAIDYVNYDMFIGVYPNDPDTIQSVQSVAKDLNYVHPVINKKDGPTNKADNLNNIIQFIHQFEKEKNVKFEIFVFHDSEDIIHPLSLKLYNYLIPRKDMIQIPVFPLEVQLKHFTHWVYADEFSENHTKDIIVREAIHAMVPSAGVGTAFSRHAIETLRHINHGKTFSSETLTEDYSTALQLSQHGIKQIFVNQYVMRTVWRRSSLGFGKLKAIKKKEYIATRALFPLEYLKSVRQKARWIMGISMQEWSHSGWQGNWATKYTLLHDRKSLITHGINLIGYVVFIFWLFYSIAIYNHPEYPSLQERLNQFPWVWYLILACTIIMFERLFQRSYAVMRVYDLKSALGVFPRAFYGNIINMHALARALRIFIFGAKKNKPAAWDKTEHHFPGSHILIPYKRRLGDLLLENRIISKEKLNEILSLQHASGKPLGEILKEKKLISAEQLTILLAKQYKLKLLPRKHLHILRLKEIGEFSRHEYRWLLKHKFYPIKIDQKEKVITLAFIDPNNEALIKTCIHRLQPYQVEFVMLGQAKKIAE